MSELGQKPSAAATTALTGSAEFEWGGHRLHLLPGKAVWLPQRRWLLVADVHLGKAASFRRLGVPVPQGSSEGSLARLSALVRAQQPQAVVVLGDLLHSAHAQAPHTQTVLRAWRDAHPGLTVTLVRGNHDARAGDPDPRLDIEVVDEPWHIPPPHEADDRSAPGLALCHHPGPVAGHQVLAGHDHPCLWLGGRGRDRLRLPCFHFGADGVGVLPAFGSFTGMHPLRKADGDAAFVIAGDVVRPV